MKLHFLGTAGYHPNNERQTSCLFIPEVALMLDAGTGLYRCNPLIVHDELDILISHAHLDHVFGLTILLETVALTPLKKIRIMVSQASCKPSASIFLRNCCSLFCRIWNGCHWKNIFPKS